MRRQKKYNMILFLIILLLGLGLGYAALSANLEIDGITNLTKTTWDIHFDHIQETSGGVTPNSTTSINAAGDTVSFNITLSAPGDFYEFTVDAVNAGTVDGMIESFSSTLNGGSISNLPDCLEYSATYSDGVAIASNHLLEAGNTETYKIRVEFKMDIQEEDLPTSNQTLSFTFSVNHVQRASAAISKPAPTTVIKAVIKEGNYDYTAFWNANYINKIKVITLNDRIRPPANVIESWDISESQTGDVMAYLTANQSDNSYYDLYIQGNGSLYANPDSSYLFYNMTAVDEIRNIDYLNTSNVTNMEAMFSELGSQSQVFTLDLGNNFDTSNVINMTGMFSETGGSSRVFTLNLGNKFDTSNVTNMSYMFGSIGQASNNFILNLGNKFDTSSVTDMSYMFYNFRTSSLDLGDKFDTSNVTNMASMFGLSDDYAGIDSLNLGDNFNTSKVTDMSSMFSGQSSLSSLNLKNKFDTSNVTNMANMFSYTGANESTFTLNLGSQFDTSNVTNMGSMFKRTGYSNPSFSINLGSKFNTSKVTNMLWMFKEMGNANVNLELDLSTFDFSNVTSHLDIFEGFKSTNKIYVKDATDQSWVIARNSSVLSTSNVIIKNS